MPYLVAKFHNASMRRQLASLSREHRPSCVYVDHLAMMHLVPDVFGRPRVVLGQHNAEYEFFAQFEREKKGLLRRVAAWERRAAEAYERAALLRADATVAIGERDRDTFARLAGIQAFVVRPAMVPRPLRAGPGPDQPMAFGYVGHLTWRPNVEGLDWLVQRVWPAVRAALPDATLEITGAGLAPGHVPAAWRAPGVTVSGLVLDLEELYGRTHVMVAPVRGGAGVRMKVLEAFRSGMPLVASSDALEGTGFRHEEHLLCATEPKMFAECMVRLASDVDLRERLVASARSYVMRRHSVEGARPVLRRALGLRP
jgi:glycosyltransferase involved in cell wall biosynthesis